MIFLPIDVLPPESPRAPESLGPRPPPSDTTALVVVEHPMTPPSAPTAVQRPAHPRIRLTRFVFTRPGMESPSDAAWLHDPEHWSAVRSSQQRKEYTVGGGIDGDRVRGVSGLV